MKKLFIGFTLLGVLLAYLASSSTIHTYDTSYADFAKHTGIPACTLPSIEDNGDVEDRPVVCLETNNAPTKDQLVLWTSYTTYISCVTYHQYDACKELTQ